MKSKSADLSAVTDTATLYLLSPEQLYHLVVDGSWLSLYEEGKYDKADSLIKSQYFGDVDHMGRDGRHTYQHDAVKTAGYVKVPRKLTENFVALLLKKLKSVLGKKERPLGNKVLLRDVSLPFPLSYVDGTPISDQVMIQVLAQPSKSPHYATKAGFGRSKKDGTPQILLFLNGSKQEDWFHLQIERGVRSDLFRRMTSLLLHELSHVIDEPFSKPSSLEGFSGIPNPSDMRLRDYYNNPTEIQAHLQEIFFELDDGLRDDYEFYQEIYSPSKAISFLLRNHSPTYKRIRDYLTPNSQKRIMKAVFSYVRSYKKDATVAKVAQLYMEEIG